MVVLIFLVILGLTFENLTRVTEDSLPLGNSTKTKKNFRPVCNNAKWQCDGILTGKASPSAYVKVWSTIYQIKDLDETNRFPHREVFFGKGSFKDMTHNVSYL